MTMTFFHVSSLIFRIVNDILDHIHTYAEYHTWNEEELLGNVTNFFENRKHTLNIVDNMCDCHSKFTGHQPPHILD